MTDQTSAAAPAAATPALVADDLNLVGDLVDQAKDATELWGEFEAAEQAAEKPATAPAEGVQEPEGSGAPATPAQTTPAPAAPDIWANATPEQKAAFEAERADKAKFEQRFRSSVGRISALQRKINAAQAQPSREIPSAREKVAGITNDYPELAEPLLELAGGNDELRERVSKSEKASLEADTSELNDLVAAETERLVTRHPDYADVLAKNGRAFAAWVEDQPRRIREAAVRNAEFIADADSAAEVIHEFKRHLGLIRETPASPAPAPAPQPSLNDRRARQFEASASPQRSGGRPTVSGIPENGDPQAIWNAFEAQESARA